MAWLEVCFVIPNPVACTWRTGVRDLFWELHCLVLVREFFRQICQVGMLRWMNQIFLSRRQPLISFSRAMAAPMSPKNRNARGGRFYTAL
jgi:hypothetical protein